MSTYAIGDVQGCYDPLVSLLQHINFDPDQDTLWFCGDLINRGPQNIEVLRFVRSLGKAAISLAGNHDLALLAVADGHYKPKKKDTFSDVLDAPDVAELLEYIRQLKFAHADDKLGFMMVHAGIPPAWSQDEALKFALEAEEFFASERYADFLPVMIQDEPSAWADDLDELDRIRFITNALTRMRFVTEDGHLDFKTKGGLTDENSHLAWFNAKARGQDKLQILFGHWAALMGFCPVKHIHALDTGCVWGGTLTAYRLEDNMRFSIENTR